MFFRKFSMRLTCTVICAVLAITPRQAEVVSSGNRNQQWPESIVVVIIRNSLLTVGLLGLMYT